MDVAEMLLMNSRPSPERARRYLAFAFSTYYPGGGWKDFQGSFDSLKEAQKHLKTIKPENDWFQVFDTETGILVFNSKKRGGF